VKKILSILSMLTLCVMIAAVPVCALSGVYDDACIFDSSEIDDLMLRIAALEDKTDGWEFAIVTTDDANNMTAQEYADDFWDADYYEHGALLLYDFDNGEVYISCSGDAMGLYSDARIETILDEMFVYIPSDEYHESAIAFLDYAEYFYERGLETDEPIYHVQPGESAEDYADDPVYEYIDQPKQKNYLLIVAVALLSGLAAGGIAVGVAMAKYRLKFPDRSYDISKHAQLQLTERRDDIIGHIITHRHIPKDDDHGGGGGFGGGTTIHRSSGGRVHSGGGRRM
jgi:uncharacterized protein